MDIEAFVKDIEAEAEAHAASLIADAKQEQSNSLDGLSGDLCKTTDGSAAMREAELLLSQRQTAAQIAASKIILAAKIEAVDAVYSLAKQHILELPDKEYLQLLTKLITEHAANNDKIIFAARDKNRIPTGFIKSLNTAHKLQLKASDTTHSYQGGVIIEGIDYDKNLTPEHMLQAIKQSTESDVAKILFQ